MGTARVPGGPVRKTEPPRHRAETSASQLSVSIMVGSARKLAMPRVVHDFYGIAMSAMTCSHCKTSPAGSRSVNITAVICAMAWRFSQHWRDTPAAVLTGAKVPATRHSEE